MKETINILHLTDLHFGIEVQEKYSETSLSNRKLVLNNLIEKFSKKIPIEFKPDLVVISGDIGWKGKTSDYNEAKKWIETLLKVLGLTNDDLVICAGNHDIDRDLTV